MTVSCKPIYIHVYAPKDFMIHSYLEFFVTRWLLSHIAFAEDPFPRQCRGRLHKCCGVRVRIVTLPYAGPG